ncbi:MULTISPECIES: DMT family transporter [Peribacillus]|uniref:DMT family transporter n=1 Tax=Peribacillus TaxID=2675229 RepID=UPI0019137B48|nr:MULTISPECIES: DMT family transporter [unclassified Peribacillus]MBK5443407.1 DMT family transporter [Peribacillus sp. TH24]MBK5461861.1 DMT family transporter [Peribacillus sp. TH27]MBK5484804.1 DMT family transporter [Peribacillus sp. TH16]MBK5500013.1 DMT family transporter [Peribacillus sp. TH14]WMX54943.1 DMT family transporter [Peribacillus sp. R9-11]
MKKNQVLIGALLCLTASISWGAMFPVAERALRYIDPIYFSFLRYLAVSIILGILLLIKEGKKSFCLEGKGKNLLFFGTMAFTVYNFLIFSGQDLLGHNGVIVASIMESLMPMISIMIMWVFKNARPMKYTIASMLLALIGAILVITNGNLSFLFLLKDSIIPILFILIGVIGWVIYTMGGNQFSGWSTLRYSTLTCILGTSVSGIITFFATVLGLSVPTAEVIESIYGEMIFMIIFPGAIALLSWNLGIKLLTPINGILFINVVPITTLVIVFIQGGSLTSFELLGTFLVIYALIQNNYYQRKNLPSQVEELNPRKVKRIA